MSKDKVAQRIGKELLRLWFGGECRLVCVAFDCKSSAFAIFKY